MGRKKTMGETEAFSRYHLAGAGVFLLLWFFLSWLLGNIVVASPIGALKALGSLVFKPVFWQTLAVTGSRFMLSFLLGTLIGASFGLLSGFNAKWKDALQPIHWILMSVPPVVLVMISMILFGMGSVQTIFVTALLIIPIMYTNTLEGIHSIEKSLVEMGQLYKANKNLMLKEIYLPGISSPIISGLTLSAGLGVRIVVLAEVLGAYSGLGHQFSLARTNLETEELYAWIIVCLFMVGILEFALFKPLRKRLTKWKSPIQGGSSK